MNRGMAVLALVCAVAAGALRAEDSAEMKTLMTTRGKLLFSDDFGRADVGGEWAVAKGKWEIADGALKGVELEADSHSAVIKHKMDCHDLVAQFSFKFQGGKSLAFSLNNQKGHVCRVALTAKGFVVRKDKPGKNSTEVAAKLGEVTMTFEQGKWYTMLVEVRGKEMLAMIDEQHVAFGAHEGIDADKKDVGLPVGGDCVQIDNLKIWEAQPNPDWEETRKKLALK